ncbi:MAG TPA: antibiotic biosynthesis monooxygenase [Lunatimonas sp.]|nr:antibiotic biosynthesis monooxygenase [Lunatimonas sp.]
MIAFTPSPPYYAVIFTSVKTDDDSGYAEMARFMENLVVNQPGYLGHESARSELGITVSYWESLEAIAGWKNQLAHRNAQKKGKEQWYASYRIRVCFVEREYGFPNT